MRTGSSWQLRDLLVIGLLEHGMERLGERVQRELHNMGDIERMALTIAGLASPVVIFWL